MGNLADVALAQGDLARAQATYRSALAQYRALGDPRSAGLAHQGLGALALVQGDTAEAARQLHEGLAIPWASAKPARPRHLYGPCRGALARAGPPRRRSPAMRGN